MDSDRRPFDPDFVGHADIDPRTNELSNLVIGAPMAVHSALGPGHLESVYQNALCIELRNRSIPHVPESRWKILYSGEVVGEGRIDILVEDVLLVEIKAVECLAPIHAAQLNSYLKAINLRLGLLINFNVIRLKDGIKRVIR